MINPAGRHRPDVRCPRCGYDVRGGPDSCPECGTAVVARVVYLDHAEFDAAREALLAANVDFQFSDPRDGLIGASNLLYGFNHQPQIFIALGDLRTAFEALDEAGVGAPRPILDAESPTCPFCGTDVPRHAASCPACRIAVEWFGRP